MTCTKQSSKKYTKRQSPPYPANECRNKIKKGNDGNKYKSVEASNGVYRWKLHTKTKKRVTRRKTVRKRQPTKKKLTLRRITKSKSRPCGPRRNKTNNAYSKQELIDLASQKGIKTSGLNVSDLCKKVLNISPAFNSKSCGTYSIEELSEFAKSLKLSSQATSSSVQSICNSLISSLANALQYNCSKFKIAQLRELAQVRGLLINGNKKDLCERILKWEYDNVSKTVKSHYIKYLEGKTDSMNIDPEFERLSRSFTSKTRPEGSLREFSDKKKLIDYISKSETHPLVSLKEFSIQLNSTCDGSCDNPTIIGKMTCKNISKLPCIANSKLPLKHHQQLAVEHILKNRSLLVIHGTGSGKTLTSVTAVSCVLAATKLKVVIVTPTSLEKNMKKEFVRYGMNPDNPRISYFTLQKFVNMFDGDEKKLKNTFLVIDEAHNLKTYKGERSKVFLEASKYVSKILLLTATPIFNNPAEIINLIGLLDKGETVSIHHFNNHILPNENELKKYLKCKISYFKCDKKVDYPSMDEHYVDLTMDSSFYKKYLNLERNELQKLNLSLFGANPKNLQVFFNGIRRGVNNLESEYGPKIDKVMEKVKASKKILIYSSFLDSGINLIIKRLKKLNRKFEYIDGSMSQEERQDVVEEYNDDKVNVLLITRAGGEGLDLKGTRDVVILEPTWNWASIEQVIGRGNRYRSHSHLPPKEQHVDVWYIRLKKPEILEKDDKNELSIDEYLYEMVEDKKKMNEGFIKKIEKYSIENNDC